MYRPSSASLERGERNPERPPTLPFPHDLGICPGSLPLTAGLTSRIPYNGRQQEKRRSGGESGGRVDTCCDDFSLRASCPIVLPFVSLPSSSFFLLSSFSLRLPSSPFPLWLHRSRHPPKSVSSFAAQIHLADFGDSRPAIGITVFLGSSVHRMTRNRRGVWSGRRLVEEIVIPAEL